MDNTRIKNFGSISIFMLLWTFIISCQSQNSNVPISFDIKEYPLGYPDSMSSPLKQLKNFPSPRYKENHSLLPNYNWISSIHLLGGIGKEKSKELRIKDACLIQKELVENWNYYFHLGNSKLLAAANPADSLKNPISAFLNEANKHPEWPVSLTTFWMSSDLRNIGEKERGTYIRRQDLPDEFYTSGVTRKSRFKTLSFTIPDSLLAKDGLGQNYYIQTVLSKLNRPLNIINENGETRPHYPYKESILDSNKALKQKFEKSDIKNWDSFIALEKLRFRKLYRNGFYGSTLEDSGTLFTWYGVDGHPGYRFNWKESREIQSEINGNFYSTPDYYPRWPRNWFKGSGAWKGWRWLEKSRQAELRSGDKLFSPFVAAGWDKNPEKNIRPSQWLGLMKCMGVIGAEFYYTGFFNINRKAIADPKNYIWQAVIPSYAQAITSRYEAILRYGNVPYTMGRKKNIYLLRIPSQEKNTLIVLRKMLERSIYVIGGVYIPEDSDEIEGESVIRSIDIEGTEIDIEIRKQGSIYYFDNSSPENPLFYQLDKWHEPGHPERWAKMYRKEAELLDNGKDFEILTENNGNYYQYETSVSLPLKNALIRYFIKELNFSPQKVTIRMKNCKNKTSVASINFGKLFTEKIKIDSKEWQVYEFHLPSMELKDASLEIRNLKGSFKIDSFSIQ